MHRRILSRVSENAAGDPRCLPVPRSVTSSRSLNRFRLSSSQEKEGQQRVDARSEAEASLEEEPIEAKIGGEQQSREDCRRRRQQQRRDAPEAFDPGLRILVFHRAQVGPGPQGKGDEQIEGVMDRCIDEF